MERGLAEARKMAGIGQNRLRVGTLYSLTLETVPQLIMGMKLRRPELEMDLTMGSNETLLHKLEEGSLDAILISISESELDSANLEMLPLFHDEIFLAAPAAAKLNTSAPADLRDYRQQNSSLWPKGLPPMPGFRKPSISPGLSRRLSPG
jgi:LysR family malonate utilization transcriptional regulator